jgi:predicted transposase/invertase (TIGR01784 family)
MTTDELKAVIFIAITDFIMLPNTSDYRSPHINLDEKTYTHDLKDFSYTFLELPKFHKTIDELHTLIEKWVYFFKHAEETSEAELIRIAGSDEIIHKAYEALNRFSWTEIELNTYEQQEKREQDAQAIIQQKLIDAKAEGKAEGLTEGEAKGKAETIQQTLRAIELLVQGKTLEEVHMMTGLEMNILKVLRN